DGHELSLLAGKQGDYNNCIAVAPDSATVAIGWQKATFLSQDGGATFRMFGDANLHSDVHALTFDPADAGAQTLYIGSDGGVAMTRDGGETFDSTGNRMLANLEFYSTYVTRDFYGTLSLQGDLVAGGLQDNGNVVCQRTAAGTLTSWAPVEGCDGGAVIFIATGQVLTDQVCGTGTNLRARALHGRSLYDIDPGAPPPARGRPRQVLLPSP